VPYGGTRYQFTSTTAARRETPRTGR
jgi:hypothetical protein